MKNHRICAFNDASIVTLAALALAGSAACGQFDPDLLRELSRVDKTQSQPGDTTPEADVAPVPPARGPFSWQATKFDYPRDAQSCDGPQFVRIDERGVVGVVACGEGAFRVYLTQDPLKSFIPVADMAGHGQDHCELLNPDFTISNEDDITSGGCAKCSTGVDLPLEGVTVYGRSNFGEPFELVKHTPEWSYQVSRLNCGVDVAIGATPAK